MARQPPDPDLVHLVIEAAATGTSHAEIAKVAGVAESTVRSWLHKYGGGKGLRTDLTPTVKRALTRRIASAHAEPPPPTDAPPAESPPTDARATAFDALAEAKAALASLKAIVHEAKAVGNMTAAQRAVRDIANVVNTIARIERTLGGEGEIRVSKAEIAEAREAVRARMAAVLSAPLLCAHCGRQMRIDWTKGK